MKTKYLLPVLIAVSIRLCIIVIMEVSWLFPQEKREPLIVPANEIFIIDTTEYVGESGLKIEAHLKNNNKKKYVIMFSELSPDKKEKLNIALKNNNSFLIQEEYVNSGPRPDPNISGIYRYPVTVMRNKNGIIIKINDIEALLFK